MIIEDAHGLPPELLKTLIGLARQVSQRDATMPVALVCPEAEADYLEGIAQNAGRAPEQIQRITLLPMAEQQPRRRGWRLGRAWLALPVLAVAAGALSLYWLGPRLGAISEPETSGDPIAEVSTTRPEPVASAPPTEGTADDAHGGDDAVVSLPPQIASASVFMTATIPALPEPLRTGTTTPPADVASARDRDLAENPSGPPRGSNPGCLAGGHRAPRRVGQHSGGGIGTRGRDPGERGRRRRRDRTGNRAGWGTGRRPGAGLSPHLGPRAGRCAGIRRNRGHDGGDGKRRYPGDG
ncbi:MAG: hypothetical protein U5L11_04030 [Arhodomonas sp.]|nr:hypothetical protein [Arhodomonas sp.]